MPEQPTARLISSATLWHLHVSEGRRDELLAWVRANGIDPDVVPVDRDMVIENGPAGRMIRHTVFVHSSSGNKLADPIRSGDPLIEERTTPLVVEPPADWPVYAVPGPA